MNQLPGSGLNDVVTTKIPVVSMANWRAGGAQRRDFAADVVEACHQTGFLLLVDHGVSEDLIKRYFNALQMFFALPTQTKALMAKSKSRHFRGWEAIGADLTGPTNGCRRRYFPVFVRSSPNTSARWWHLPMS